MDDTIDNLVIVELVDGNITGVECTDTGTKVVVVSKEHLDKDLKATARNIWLWPKTQPGKLIEEYENEET